MEALDHGCFITQLIVAEHAHHPLMQLLVGERGSEALLHEVLSQNHVVLCVDNHFHSHLVPSLVQHHYYLPQVLLLNILLFGYDGYSVPIYLPHECDDGVGR